MAFTREWHCGLILRVDDRLLHGQVIFGWGVSGPAKKIWLINDRVAENAKERELYLTALPQQFHGGILTLKEALLYWSSGYKPSECTLGIVETCEDLAKLIRGGIQPEEIHLGAIARADDRQPVSDCVALSETERGALRIVKDAGYTPLLLDLHNSQPVPFNLNKV